MDDLFHVGDKWYAAAEATIITDPKEQLSRELASAIPDDQLNDSFIWIAGRYVQGNVANRNGHFWTLDDLKHGLDSIVHTPLNALHDWSRPVGTFVESKLVHRKAKEKEEAAETLPEIQTLAVFWAANFPELAMMVRGAHELKQLWFSMECVAEDKQCLTCDQTFAWVTASDALCAHLATNPKAPRRLINPTFIGGALIFPPETPAWPDAEVTEVARELTSALQEGPLTVESWEQLMELTQQN